MEQSMGLMGVVYGSDIGGCAGTLGGNGESYARWLEMEVFNFFTRSHVNGSEDKEPWSYGPAAEAAAAKWLRWKYRMLPYIYTAAWEMSRTGVPLHRPLVFEFRTDPAVRDMADEFMFGDWMLVAPVVHGDESGATDTSRSVYLPAGRWIDYRDGATAYDGPTTLSDYHAPLDDVPVFVKAGAIIPMEDWTEHVGERPLDLVTLDVYPHGASAYTRYEDDGETLAYRDGAYCTTRFESEEAAGAVAFTIRGRTGAYTPHPRDYLLVIHGDRASVQDVRLNGTPLAATTPGGLDAGERGWAPDDATGTLRVRFEDTGGEIRVEAR
jgi:alpha-glucosidase (family GH31 glycosyl hydrolase)